MMSWHYTQDNEPSIGSRVRVHSSENWGIGTAIYKGQGQWDRVKPLPLSEPLGEIDAWQPIPARWWQLWQHPMMRGAREWLSPLRQFVRD
jgi:hypothetical protein